MVGGRDGWQADWRAGERLSRRSDGQAGSWAVRVVGSRGGGQAASSADEEESHIPTTLSLFEGQDDSITVGMYAMSTISRTDTVTGCRMAERI